MARSFLLQTPPPRLNDIALSRERDRWVARGPVIHSRFRFFSTGRQRPPRPHTDGRMSAPSDGAYCGSAEPGAGSGCTSVDMIGLSSTVRGTPFSEYRPSVIISD